MKEIIPVSKNDPCGEPGAPNNVEPIAMGPSGCPMGSPYSKLYVHRMIAERSELQEKITKLDTFIDGDKFRELSIVKQDLLVSQYNAMLTYLGILEMRLKFEGVKL